MRDASKTNSIYSAQSDPKIENLLKEQHAFTIETIASAFLEDKNPFEEKLAIWADTVARSRVDTTTPIHEVLAALGRTRTVIWDFIKVFCSENKTSIAVEDVLKWSSILQETFERLYQEFSKLYFELLLETIQSRKDLLIELGSPVIPITESAGVLPLVGDMDVDRAEHILNTVPQKCNQEHISHLFVDFSGVSVLNEAVVHYIYNLVDVLRLLGIKTSFSGIGPESAMFSVQLGIDMHRADSYNTLQQALIKNKVQNGTDVL
jgi:rsbT co-antagonist protein RsbR